MKVTLTFSLFLLICLQVFLTHLTHAEKTTTAADDDDNDNDDDDEITAGSDATITPSGEDSDDEDGDENDDKKKKHKKRAQDAPTTPIDEDSFKDEELESDAGRKGKGAKKEKKGKDDKAKKGDEDDKSHTDEGAGGEDVTLEITAPPLPTLSPDSDDKKNANDSSGDGKGASKAPLPLSDAETFHMYAPKNDSVPAAKDALELDKLSSMGMEAYNAIRGDTQVNGDISYHFNDITNITPSSLMNATDKQNVTNTTTTVPQTPFQTMPNVEQFAKDATPEVPVFPAEPKAAPAAVKSKGLSGSGSYWMLCLLIIPIVIASVVIVYVLRKQDAQSMQVMDPDIRMMQGNVIKSSFQPHDVVYPPSDDGYGGGHVSAMSTQGAESQPGDIENPVPPEAGYASSDDQFSQPPQY